jgi:hypothetical protein
VKASLGFWGKEGSKMYQEHTTISNREVKTTLKQAYEETWQHQVGEYKHHTDTLRNLDRKESTIIIHTDHFGLRGHLQ